MAEKREYKIKVQGKLAPVTREAYLVYYRTARREKFLEEKDKRNGKALYSDLDAQETTGEEMIPDLNLPSVEDVAIANMLREKLHRCIALLPQTEQELIRALYFEHLTERKLSERTGVPQRTINDRKHRALARLKIFIEENSK